MTAVFVAPRHFALGMALLALGLVASSIHFWLERSETLTEQELQRAWEDEIRRIAEDVSLEGYGITSLADLARYHDASGRAEVLDALRRLPVGQRALLSAARQVDPDGIWD